MKKIINFCLVSILVLFGLTACVNSTDDSVNHLQSDKVVKIGFALEKDWQLLAEIYAQTLEINNIMVERVNLTVTQSRQAAVELVQSGIVDFIPVNISALLTKLYIKELEAAATQEEIEAKAISVLPQGISVGDRLDFALPLSKFDSNGFDRTAPLYNLLALEKYPARAINRVSGELSIQEFKNLLNAYNNGANLTKLVSDWASQRILIG